MSIIEHDNSCEAYDKGCGCESRAALNARIAALEAELAEARAEVARLEKLVPKAQEYFYWWCPNCKEELNPKHVTFSEYHELCGHHAVWVSPEPPATTQETSDDQ